MTKDDLRNLYRHTDRGVAFDSIGRTGTPASKLLQRSIREMTVVWLYSAPVVPGYECFIGLYSVQQPTSQPYTKTHLIWLGS